jgi:hypothetical protein
MLGLIRLALKSDLPFSASNQMASQAIRRNPLRNQPRATTPHGLIIDLDLVLNLPVALEPVLIQQSRKAGLSSY